MKNIKTITIIIILALTISCTTSSNNQYISHPLEGTIAVNKVEYGYSIIPNCYEMVEGLIFYPGGKVEPESYIPLLTKLANEYEIAIFIPKMPFNLAILNKNAAINILKEYNYIKSWYIAGHSLGGVMASSYVYDNPKIFKGLILLASYPEDSKQLKDEKLKVISIVGSEDKVINIKNYQESENNLPINSEFITIEGGNHSQFGSYGLQKNDGISSISEDEQQSITVSLISKFLSNN